MSNHLVWFRNDLRLHDHQPLVRACNAARQSGGAVIPVYVFDPRFDVQTSFGWDRLGLFRKRFLRQSLHDLSEQVSRAGSKLCFLNGYPEVVLPSLCEKTSVSHVYWYHSDATEEASIGNRLSKQLQRVSVKTVLSRPATLYDPAELPFPVSELPEVFSNFRRKVEKHSLPPPVEPNVDCLPPISGELSAAINSLELDQITQLRTADALADPRGVMPFVGGETAGLERIEEYFWRQDRLRTYKTTRNGMLGASYSSKFSPWLALGCLSARKVYWEVQRYQAERIQNDSTYWLVFELLWRDYFAFIMAKHGANLFKLGGIKKRDLSWSQDAERFEKWVAGETGYPLIDANMKELAATGFMSNRGRQNVASFLTKNLGIDWRMGAEWFESMLIDFDPASNYGNWNYVAGVGNDARQFRWFNPIKQARDYDADGKYLRHWLPALKGVPVSVLPEPWKMNQAEQASANCQIGIDYPTPIVDLLESAHSNAERFRMPL